MYKHLIKIIVLLITFDSHLYSQEIINVVQKYVLIDCPNDSNIKVGDVFTISRKLPSGQELNVGQIKIITFRNNNYAGEIISQKEDNGINIGDFILIDEQILPNNNSQYHSLKNNNFKPFVYKSFLMNYSNEKYQKYSMRLDFVPWFFENFLASIQGSIGNRTTLMSNSIFGFSFGIGNTLDISLFRLNGLLFYSRVYDPDIPRFNQKSKGRNFTGIDVNLQLKLSKLLLSMGYKHLFDSNIEEQRIKTDYFCIGVGYDLY